jgi:hypothetical protein
MSNLKNKLKYTAIYKLIDAEEAYINYVMYLPIGRDRELAYEVLGHIKNGISVFNPISNSGGRLMEKEFKPLSHDALLKIINDIDEMEDLNFWEKEAIIRGIKIAEKEHGITDE